MHNMSNQFYNYISQIVLEYFKDEPVRSGDRFYLQLDNAVDVQGLVEALRNQGDVKIFIYQHELGEPYETFSIEVKDVRVVIAYTTDNVTPDFLVTLRNQVGEQNNVWKGTALLSIVSEQLDSIQGGSSDLQKEGMPLHPSSLFKRLKNDIEKNSPLVKMEQIILLDNMEKLLQEQEYQQITFFEFEDIFAILAKGSIENQDYQRFGLFKDEELGTLSGNKLKERLNLNRELYEQVRKVHDLGLGEEELEKRFTASGASLLKREDWQQTEFPTVHKHYQDALIAGDTRVTLKEIQLKGFQYWDRPHKDTAGGRRKRHIIVFNPEYKEEVQITASFLVESKDSKTLSSSYVKIPPAHKKDLEVKVGRTNLQVVIHVEQGRPKFVRFSYKHENKAVLGAEFLITILPIEPYILEVYKTAYAVDPAKKFLELQYEGEQLSFGSGYNKKTVEVFEDNQTVTFAADEQLTIVPQPEAFNDKEELHIHISLTDREYEVPILLKNELPESIPITGSRIWRLKRESQQDFEWNDNRLVFGNREFYLNPEYKLFLEWEKSWIKQGMKYAVLESDVLVSEDEDIQLSVEMREEYSRFLTYFRTKQNIPSLCYYSSELVERAVSYLKAYIQEIQSFKEGHEAGRKGRDLFKLGVLFAQGNIYFTPFHPLMVAFQLQMQQLAGSEEIDNSILGRLKVDGLLPFIYSDQDQPYKPDSQASAIEWLEFKPVSQVSIADASKYLAKVIEDKINQFEEHFAYLFSEHSKAPLQINMIGIENDLEFVRGLLQWMLKKIEARGGDVLKPIEVTLYKESHAESFFDIFSRTDSIEQFEEKFRIKLSSKQYEPQDLIRFLREKLFYFKRGATNGYKYAHISFYKMNAQESHALQSMEDMLSGITLDGLYTSVSSMKGAENYRTGFGTKTYRIDDDNLLTQTAYSLNELAANLRNGGNDAYRKGEAIFSRTTTADEKTLEAIFNSSHWVTFVDPSVDLEFFNSYKNIVVIHYSDQYSSSTRYDAITVTNKSQQYYAVIKEFLKTKEVESSEENVENTIKAFNTFNGEWLLRIIGSKGHYSREKLSIISAIKFSLAYFDHEDILWVPVSLEEILRVAGAVSLNKSEGVFTAKNLGVKGSHSDDLLLIGLEKRKDNLKMHFYPVEVKIGINKGDVLEKAKQQVKHTKKLINEALAPNSDKPFTSRFYRNFFVQLFIANANKLQQSHFWLDKSYNLSDEIIEKLLKDEFAISNSLQSIIGEGAILSFQRDAYHRSAEKEEEVTYLNLIEFDGYNGLIRSMEDMRQWIQVKESDFVKEDLLSYRYKDGIVKEGSIDSQQVHVNEITPRVNREEEKVAEESKVAEQKPSYDGENQDIPIPSRHDEEEPEANIFQLEDARILIGKAENSNRDIYWEFGNKGLANRHLLISGKSGQGKTYFMQCLLLEKSKQGIPSIVIDYTEGFLPDQLEEEFIGAMGSKLRHRIVYNEKLPINPFKGSKRIIGGIEMPESHTDIAERIKSVFSSVYKTLGIQQLNAIYDAILKGLETYGEQMDLPKLKTVLEQENSNYAKTALLQIRPLIDRNPFSSNNMNWDEIVESDGEVLIIQLTAYPREVQLIITEFILWDLWNYSIRHGNKNRPMPVIMDEAQNLDHRDGSPSARILTEGRKFGWSAWYATQFLKSQLSADELARLQNASEKIYFSPPEQEITTIAASLASHDPAERKKWEARLSSLRKGQCIVHAPVLMDNGELSKPAVTVVNITPLSERL